jgi:hypothetical protein
VRPQPSRTINQLHFEDLEVHRFEDLVRQLVYGFRRWVVLEPLGRSGADEGIDIRGIEAVRPSSDEEGSDDDPYDEGGERRAWFIQCKREKAVGPSKARALAADAMAGAIDPPYGFLLAAPCELSKRTREALAQELQAASVRPLGIGKTSLV